MFKTMKKREIGFIALLFFIAIGASTSLVKEHLTANVPEGVSKIGTLEKFGSDVKRKYFGELAFEETAKTETLYQKDTIFVGPGSKAKFDLPDYGGEFMLEPNSIVLVVLDFENKSDTKGKSDPTDAKTQIEEPRLRLKLVQGKISFKKYTNTLSKTPEKPIVVEVADNTLVDLRTQEKISFEKQESGTLKVSEATAPVVAHVYQTKDNTPILVQSVALEMNEKISESTFKASTSAPEAEMPKAALPPVVITQQEENKTSQPGPTQPPEKRKSAKRKLAADTSPVVAVKADPINSVAPANPEIEQQAKIPRQSGLHLGPFSYEAVGLTAKDVVGLKANAAANSVLGVGIGYGYDLSDSLSLSVDAQVKQYQFTGYSDAAITNNTPTTLALSTSLEKEVSDQTVLSVKLSAENILSLEPKSSIELALKSLLAPVAGVSVAHTMGDTSKTLQGFQLKLSADVLLPAQGDGYTSKSGHRESLKFLTIKDSEVSRFSAGFTAYQQSFSTPYTENKQIGIGFELTIGLAPANKKYLIRDSSESSGVK